MKLTPVIALALVLVAPSSLAQKASPNAQPRQELLAAVAEMDRLLGEMQKSHEALSRLNGDLARHVEQLSQQSKREFTKLEGNASPNAVSAMKQLHEAQMSFNMQYLALQQKMQDESRRFTLLSNVMKTKHDTVKNSISNIR